LRKECIIYVVDINKPLQLYHQRNVSGPSMMTTEQIGAVNLTQSRVLPGFSIQLSYLSNRECCHMISLLFQYNLVRLETC